MSENIRRRMFADFADKSAFEAARDAAYRYADQVSNRNVFPTPEAVAALAQFDEPLPEEPGDATQIVATLDRYGSPASVAQIGGRYFGLVNGGVIPASLAVRLPATAKGTVPVLA